MIKVNNEVVKFKQFNDGTLRLNYLPEALYGSAEIIWLYDNDVEMSYLYFLVKHLRTCGINRLTLNMPYVPHARMDRVKDTSECFTLKYFCDFINSLQFSRVWVFDVHSRVVAALLNNVEVKYPKNVIATLLKKYPNATLCFPDAGSMSRYSKLLDDEVYFAFGVKDREWSTQEVKSLQIMGAKHMIAGHDIILCDDILSRGSTIYLAARQLKEMGANNIYVYVSHCESTVLGPNINGQSLLSIPDLITKVYTTNSLWRGEIHHNKVEVLEVW